MVKTEWYGDIKIREMTQAMERTIIRAGNLVESTQKLLSPVDTGYLRGSINQELNGTLEVSIGTITEYAPYLEFGTRRQRQQAFIRPSLINNKKNIIEIATKEGKKAVAD